MKHLYLTSLLFFISLIGFSQKEFNNWYFGSNKAITFNSGSPVLIFGSPMYAGGITVSVSDSVGNLQFYSKGDVIWNRLNTVMPNGSGLYGLSGSFEQTVTSVQKLDDDSTYYLFTGGIYIPSSQIHPPSYSIIDMRLDNKKGDISPGLKNIPLPGGQRGWNAVVGTRTRNNHDAWIVIRLMDVDSNYFAAYHITVAGINPVPVLSPSIVHTPKDAPNWWPVTEEIKISPEGTKLYCLYTTDTLEICGFNNETGVVSPLFTVKPRFNTQLIHNLNSMEFSIDSKLLYISGMNSGYNIYQYNTELSDSTAFTQSILKVGSLGQHHSAMQMAPDGKIYGTLDIIDSLWVINSPSVMGAGCGFVRNAFCLLNFCHADGLPQFIQRYKAYIHYSDNCADPMVSFTSDIWPPADSIKWNFNDPMSGGANTSTLPNPVHVFTSAGTYLVELYVRHNDNRTDTSWCVLHIMNSLQPDLGPDRSVCTGVSTTFDAGACSQCTFLWTNLVTGLPVGSNQTLTTNQAGTYIVVVTDPLGCTGSDTVQLFNIPPTSVTNNPLNKTICSGESTNIPLTSNVSGTMFHWTVTLTSGSVTGFSPDSGVLINQVLVNPLSTPGIVTYHITPEVEDCPGISVDFPVTVNPGDSVYISISVSDDTICSGTAVTFTATPVNGGTNPTYQWLVNGMDVLQYAPAMSYTPANGDQASCILTSNAICATGNLATSNIITMNVATSPIVTFTRCNDSITTLNAQPFRLKGGIPSGGTYSGPGVTNGIFYPALAGAGTKTITYSYTNAALCTASASRSFVISNWSLGNCGNNLTDIRDGKIYPTVLIGSQCWFASNLNYGSMIPGSLNQRDNCIVEKYCYQDLNANCELRGAIYQWDELVRYDESLSTQGLCPPGWHIPSESDWNTLFAVYINNAFAAWPLLSTGYSGFNATLSGTRHMNVTWDWNGFSTMFWSSTSHGTTKAWSHGMNDTDPSVSLYPSFRSNAFSVRCLKD